MTSFSCHIPSYHWIFCVPVYWLPLAGLVLTRGPCSAPLSCCHPYWLRPGGPGSEWGLSRLKYIELCVKVDSYRLDTEQALW